jgi:hypothetical protein
MNRSRAVSFYDELYFFIFFKMERGTLILEDGSEFNGFVFGASTNSSGEVGKIISMNFLV